jgi:hypothetical protein
VTDETDLSASLREFLLLNIESYEQLEVLLLLGRAPELAWRIAAIAQKSQLAESIVADALHHLCERRLVSNAPGRIEAFHYAPAGTAAADSVAQLAALYEGSPHILSRVMTANAIERLRANAAGAFDALLTSRKKEGV